jgi:glycosyltransferase involved in cell wall biosynthesis
MITSSGCGVVVPPENPEAFADALIRLAGASDDNASMRRAARQLAEQDFSREKLADTFCSFIRKLDKNAAPEQLNPHILQK